MLLSYDKYGDASRMIYFMASWLVSKQPRVHASQRGNWQIGSRKLQIWKILKKYATF